MKNLSILVFIVCLLSDDSCCVEEGDTGDNSQTPQWSTLTESPTPNPESPTPEITQTPAPWYADHLGVYEVREKSCALDADGILVASGEATVTKETSDVLCAWGGTSETLYDYSCLPGVEHIPEPGEWVSYYIVTGYNPAERGQDPEDLLCVLCSATPGESGVCDD